MAWTPPNSFAHGVTIDDVREKLVPAECTNWKLSGNQLTCDTQHGPLSQTIDPSYILTGVDESGLPTFRKVG